MQTITINTTTLILSWTPAFLWQDYRIDSFNVNITNINNTERVFEASTNFEDIMEFGHLIFTNDGIDVLQPCSEFKFSVSSVSSTYGESDPSFIIGGFDEGIYNNYTTFLLLFVTTRN